MNAQPTEHLTVMDYRKRTLKTPNGTLILDKPQLRDTPFKTCVFSNYSRVDVSLKNAIIESYLKGISTRSVQEVVKTLGVDELSHASVSRIASELDDAVEQFLKRPIETEIPYLYIDATTAKSVRKADTSPKLSILLLE